MGPMAVQVRRGDIVEAVHRGHVATTDGESWGDPELTFFFRSSSKPIQAIPFVEGYDDLGDDEIAIACASHRAEPAQLTAVRKVLARAEATVEDLENGLQEARPEGKLGHNCSGKHAGMLAACHAYGWPFHPYRDPAQPLRTAAGSRSRRRTGRTARSDPRSRSSSAWTSSPRRRSATAATRSSAQ